VAFPLHDGREGIGALVVFGQPDSIDPAVRDRIAGLGLEMSPHLSAAAAVRAAETRSLTDELTGLPNRLVLERVMGQIGHRPGALLVVQVDNYRKVTEGFGHPAGEAMVKHVGLLLARTLRDGDLAARNGEEEFALWLVGAGRSAAIDVAERVRKAVMAEAFTWAGAELKLTCSIGVASYPDTARDLADIRLAAGAASRQARDAGGNRVEVASAPAPAAG
jgi:diguanylate cyclase (GGDEF)-like protein